MDFDANGNLIARYAHNPAIIDEPISMQTSAGLIIIMSDAND